ncbi:IclR family transcriptional regulator [Streptomyces sp. NPDC055692]|uniref:IclR family transcriptional regulator n=1 Tax=Streptomyces sp. NPDC055692 TaxID=3155683 RepID=UPI0034195911
MVNLSMTQGGRRCAAASPSGGIFRPPEPLPGGTEEAVPTELAGALLQHICNEFTCLAVHRLAPGHPPAGSSVVIRAQGQDGEMTLRSDETSARSHSGIQVISRAVQILRTIRETPGGLTQSELAHRLGLPRTTIHRILSALEDEELVVSSRGVRGRYRLGSEIARLAESGTGDVVRLIRPFLLDLSARLVETVDLSVLNGGVITFLDQVEAPHRLRAVSAVGESFPLHSCAPGKAILATLTPSRMRQLLPPRLPALTSRTITKFPDLLEQVKEIRETQVAYDYEEQCDGICAAGVAFEVAGQQMAVSVPVPAQRFHGREEVCARALLALRDLVAKQEWA